MTKNPSLEKQELSMEEIERAFDEMLKVELGITKKQGKTK